MTFMTGDQKVLLADARGRVRVAVERREALLDEFERSGMSGVKFAQLAGIKYQTFAVWVQKRRKARSGQAATQGPERPIAFVEAMVDRRSEILVEGHGLAIELPGGARMQIKSATQLQMAAELLRMLASAGAR
jgi:transposase